jgi:peptidoglycan hydrolase-like protein with peptidoglycan-binding domain
MANLRLGSEGQEVEDLQARLRELGFDADGELGPVTDFAVGRFQERVGLLPDGVVGPLTRAELERVDPGDPSLEEGDAAGEGPPVDRSLQLTPWRRVPASKRGDRPRESFVRIRRAHRFAGDGSAADIRGRGAHLQT